jgi:hypothetical protein
MAGRKWQTDGPWGGGMGEWEGQSDTVQLSLAADAGSGWLQCQMSI